MEIFGIPVFVIILLAYSIWSNYSDQQQKEKEQIAEKWNSIEIGINKEKVLRILGKPNRLVDMGLQEAWGYGPHNTDGLIYFVEGCVVGYQKPSFIVNVSLR